MAKTKTDVFEVQKVWGKELWIANELEYCGKLLYIKKGSLSSYHYHPKKKETFYCLKGQAVLTVGNDSYMLNPYSRPKTIVPGQYHCFYGVTDSIILEISTHHDDSDVVRLSPSQVDKDG